MLEHLGARMVEQLEAISLCLERRLPHAALILLYSSIDILGWVAADPHHTRVQETFIAWTERYMLKQSGLPCTSLELYAARCGVLHRMSWESDLSKRSDVRALLYAWGNADLAVLDAVITDRGEADRTVPVHIEDLVRAFHVAISRFVDDVKQDPLRAAAVEARSAKVFAHVPTPPARSN